MQLTITQEDWRKLTLRTRRELRRVIADSFPVTKEGGGEDGKGTEGMYELDEQMMHRFMEGVSYTTANFLKCFTGDGKGLVGDLLKATGHKEQQDLRGVLAGITKRLRKLFRDPEAYLVEWQDDAEIAKFEGYYYIKEGTRQALEEYFADKS